MNIYLFSENVFFYEGIKKTLKDEYNIPVTRITVELLIMLYENNIINKNDVFLIAMDRFNTTLSILIMLDHFSSKTFFLPYDNNTLKIANHFSSETTALVDTEQIKKIVMTEQPSNHQKKWRLTYREAITLSYRLQGKSINTVNHLLTISTKTLYSHQRNALVKMGVRAIAHLHTHGAPLTELYRKSAR